MGHRCLLVFSFGQVHTSFMIATGCQQLSFPDRVVPGLSTFLFQEWGRLILVNGDIDWWLWLGWVDLRAEHAREHWTVSDGLRQMVFHACAITTPHQRLVIHDCWVLVKVLFYDEGLLAWHVLEETVLEEVVTAFEGLGAWADLKIVQGSVQVLVVHRSSAVVYEGEEAFGGICGVSEVIWAVLGRLKGMANLLFPVISTLGCVLGNDLGKLGIACDR